MFDIARYYKAHSVAEAVALRQADPEARLLAGGTDVMIQLHHLNAAGITDEAPLTVYRHGCREEHDDLETDWQALADRAKSKGLTFYQQPRHRFRGTKIEHRTFFLEDPSGNLLEFKHYEHESAIFGEREFTSVGDVDE